MMMMDRAGLLQTMAWGPGCGLSAPVLLCFALWLQLSLSDGSGVDTYRNETKSTMPSSIFKIVHRTHKYTASELKTATPGSKPARVARNLETCEKVGMAMRYRDDTGVIEDIEAVIDDLEQNAAGAPAGWAAVGSGLREAWELLSGDGPLSTAFVLKADLWRLAVVWHRGGTYLDADALCVDNPHPVFLGMTMAIERARLGVGADPCVFAWEGSVSDDVSAPLNWAFACPARHRFLLFAIGALSERVREFASQGTVGGLAPTEGAEFMADGDIPVLSLTGPAMLGDALLRYARGQERRHSGLRSLKELRVRIGGEKGDDESSWDRCSAVLARNVEESQYNEATEYKESGDVLVLPYCMFRSRGCAHLMARWEDRVVFHHEFATDWRKSHFSNKMEL